MKAVKRIISLATLCFLIGIGVAYYNTSSLGYDNANIISYNNEELKIFDFNFNYEKVKGKYLEYKSVFPEKPMTI